MEGMHLIEHRQCAEESKRSIPSTGIPAVAREVAIWLLSTLGLLAGLFVGWCAYYMEALPVSARSLAQVRPGMTPSQVQEILGPPTSRFECVWKYHWGTWTSVDVYFDAHGQVRNVEVDR